MRIAVVDDENLICSQIEKYALDYISRNDKKSDILVYYSGESFCSALQQEAFDIIFLDIELGECSGIDVSKFIRNTQNNHKTQIVYVTGKTGYDRLLFDFQPFGFIAKPISQSKVADILKRFQEIYGKCKATFRYTLNHSDCWVKLSDILYFESDGRRVNMYLNGAESPITFNMKMTDIYEAVKGGLFLFIHKSFIVNDMYVSEFCSDCVRMTNGAELPVSRLRKKEILQRQITIEMGESNDNR